LVDTVAILAQGTNRADAFTQAFLRRFDSKRSLFEGAPAFSLIRLQSK
jgi:hypothetical protein